MAEIIQENILNQLARDFIDLPGADVSPLADLYGMSLRQVKDIVYSDLFKEKVLALRKELLPSRGKGDFLTRVKEKGEIAAVTRLYREIDNESDGSPATRIAASRALLETKQAEKNAAILAVELSEGKFRAILGVGNGSSFMKVPDDVGSVEDLDLSGETHD